MILGSRGGATEKDCNQDDDGTEEYIAKAAHIEVCLAFEVRLTVV